MFFLVGIATYFIIGLVYAGILLYFVRDSLYEIPIIKTFLIAVLC